MLTAVRLGGYAGVLGVVFGAAWGAGALVGPVAPPPAVAPMADMPAADAGTVAVTGPPGHVPSPGHTPADGLSSSSGGYTLTPRTTLFTPGRTADLGLVLTGPEGTPATAFEPGPDGSPLRLSLVRRDSAGFRALAPVAGPDGTWTTPLRLPTAGAWRVLADFTPAGGPRTVLGTDLFAAGDFTPLEFRPARAADVDGYAVRLDGELRPGTESAIFATIGLGGRGVTDLEPERGAFGQVVALRAGDLAYVPVTAEARPAPGDRSGPGIAFRITVPTEGLYRLYLTFRHAGALHTVDFTVPTTGAAGAAAAGGHR